MYMSGEGTDWAGDCAGSIMADDAASGTIFLVGDVHGGSGGFGEGVEVSCVGYDGMVGIVEVYVAYSELLSTSAVLVAMASVFANVE